jgi:hypothetical protein
MIICIYNVYFTKTKMQNHGRMDKALHCSWYLPYSKRNPELDDPKPQGIDQDQRMKVPPVIKLKA